MSSRVSLILVLPLPFFRSFPLLFFPPELEEDEHDASLAHLVEVPFASEEGQPLAGHVHPQRPAWLPSSTLLPPLWCRSLLGLDSMSTWTSILFPSLEHRGEIQSMGAGLHTARDRLFPAATILIKKAIETHLSRGM